MTRLKGVGSVEEFSVGDLFLIPLEEGGGFSVGQILAIVPELLDSVICAYFGVLANEDENTKFDMSLCPISVQFTSSDLLLSGRWRVFDNQNAIDVSTYYRLEDLRQSGYLNIDVRGSRNMSKFVAAYLGLFPWNSFYREDYLDELLLAGVKRPDAVYFE